jgi:predicted TIM-barrel fold metal-dependent hydrolase
MIGDIPVIDGVVHPYDLGPANRRESAIAQIEGVYRHHVMYQPADGGYVLPHDVFVSDFDYDLLTHALFVESSVDLAVAHALPDLGFTEGPLTDVARLAPLRDENPGRFLVYGTLNPLDTYGALKALRHQVEEYRIDGLKLYPSVYYEGRRIGWSAEDREMIFPIFEALLELGLQNVAIHKAIPVGSASIRNYRVDDIEGAALEFPDLNFQIVHAGYAFLEETCILMRRFPNVYATLENTMSWAVTRPRLFLETLGELIYHGGAHRVIFGDGCNLVHPYPSLEAFMELEMPEDLVAGKGFAPLTDDVKRAILAGNIAALHHLDVDAALAAIEDDHFSVEKRELTEGAVPWAGCRGS